ncbi:DDE-type integrase/transposase/recombinase [Pontivivens ytuae]|uniref:DDE-type integrase/transposase/recombinase n=1 Tax=Pontivivens ytuae TaxID=2789856 RepID=A0A7S9LWJ9_9RHOB|nr:DDE-type integrase/transposase/recombinase [Pontivivens ytuae]
MSDLYHLPEYAQRLAALCFIIDLLYLRVVGWSAQYNMATYQSLLTAAPRREPTDRVTVPSDHGSRFTSRAWQSCLRQNGLEPSLSQHGSCYDNAESFFQLLKRQRIRSRTYQTSDAAQPYFIEYFELF